MSFRRAYFALLESQRDHRLVMRSTRRRPVTRVWILTRIQRLLGHDAGIPRAAVELLGQVRFAPDELTEAGVPYETVRALEAHYPRLLARL